MRKKAYDHDMTINDMIRNAGWFNGSENDWRKLATEERESLAFAGTGCAVAYPTWKAPVNCVHTGCQIKRGELPLIAMTNRILRSEMQSGYLRFLPDSTEGRKTLALICRHIRNEANQTGIYDPWKMANGWKIMVSAAVSSF